MDLDKLSQDIKSSFVYVTSLKEENETLQTTITSLEAQNTTLQALLKEKEQGYNELLRLQSLNENNVLDRIMTLQIDQKLKEEHKILTAAHEELQCNLQKTLEEHQKELCGLKEEGEERVRFELGKVKEEFELMRKERDEKEVKLNEEISKLKDMLRRKDQERAEETTKLQLEHEEKLQSVQRAAVSTHNIDVYKRKLAAQRMEYMQEVQGLRQQIAQLQAQSGRGRRRGGYN